MARPRMRSNRLPVPPRPLSSRVHGPGQKGSTESAIDHVRRIAREKRLEDKPFDPSKRGTWRGSSRDLVVNGRVEDECIVITLDGERFGTAIGNPLDVPRGRHARETSLFAFSFGTYGDTKVAVWEAPDHIDSALERAAEWLSDYAPGIFTDVNSEEDEVDMTYTESGYIASYEWHVDELTRGPLYDAALAESEKAFEGEYGDKYDHELEPNRSRTLRQNATNKYTLAGGLADDDQFLTQLVQSTAEGMEMKRWKNARATEALVAEARRYDAALWEALKELVKRYPPKHGDAEALWDAEAAYLVLMTLQGQGVGIWDGRWDEFYDNTDRAQEFLRERLGSFSDGTGGGSLENALMDAASESCE